MFKISFIVFCLLAAQMCFKVQGGFRQRVREALRDHEERLDRLDEVVFGSGTANVTMKIENDQDPTWTTLVYYVSVPAGHSVFQMMVTAYNEYTDFTFLATYYPQWAGHFINSIVGVAGNTTEQTYWSFENGNGTPFDRGVDLIGVFNGDVIVFRFTSWSAHP